MGSKDDETGETTMLAEQIRESVEIRRSNGQCGYGEWLTADEVPARVVDAVVESVVTTDEDEGEVTVGGQVWLWRR